MLKSIPSTIEASADIRQRRHSLDAIFAPKTVAVLGATEKTGSVGRTVLWNLISNPFGGTVFPVNPKRSSIMGIKAYPNIAAVPEPVDLAVVVTPAPTVPGVIGECVAAGVKGAIIISAGFKEIGAKGIELEQQILTAQASYLHTMSDKMRIIGPNCLGVMSPLTGLNATFAPQIASPGSVGFISQSGALCTSILDWSHRENVGFSAFISIGSMLDVDWGDLINYLGDDPQTKSIVIYMESIGNARSFLSAAREVALTKPIIVIKAGRTTAAAQAAASHTGSLSGSDAVLNAAFRRCGILRVNSIDDLFNMAAVLAKQPRPKGPKLTILTNAGGPGVIATDALIAQGGELAQLAPATIEALNQLLPPQWSHHNPIDILGDADPERYARALEIAAQDPNSDGLLAILTPQSMTDPTQTAERLKSYVEKDNQELNNSSQSNQSKIQNPKSKIGKPILASWMGGANVAAGEMILNRANISTFPFPDTAARAFNYMWQYSYNLRGLYETPILPASCDSDNVDCASADEIIHKARQQGRTILTEWESKQLLAAYSIPTVETYVATNVEAAVSVAEAIAYPVVLKLFSETITHKTDVGGVQLNLQDADAVRAAYQAIELAVREKVGAEHFLGITVQPMIPLDGYELIVGSSIDPQFGPVLLFGMGGQLVEVFQDRALALPPLNSTLARRMMEQTQIYQALKGVRGRSAVDLAALEQLLVRFSQLVIEQRWIKEIDINPLLVKPGEQENSAIALDARVVLHETTVIEDELPKLAIRPYPTQYVSSWQMKDGTSVTIRPIRPEDEPLMIQFHQSLSEESVYLRYAHLTKLSYRISHERLTRICFIDYDREIALVAEYEDPQTQEHQIVAVGRLSKLHHCNEAEFALVVSDRYQCRGLGTQLLKQLLQIGWDEKLSRITADILPDNLAMQHICKKLGFCLFRHQSESMVKAEITISRCRY